MRGFGFLAMSEYTKSQTSMERVMPSKSEMGSSVCSPKFGMTKDGRALAAVWDATNRSATVGEYMNEGETANSVAVDKDSKV